MRQSVHSCLLTLSLLGVAQASDAPVGLATSNVPAGQAASVSSGTQQAWYDTAWSHVKQTWNDGRVEAYVPFWTYHLPFAYTPSQRENYNEFPAGFGLGKGRFNNSGNWEGIYAMGFCDSHGDPSFMLGYGWIPTWRVNQSDFKVGVGLTAFLMSRTDYWNGIPFPGVLPVASIGYKNLNIQAAYVPGGTGNGNVIFAWTKWTFD